MLFIPFIFTACFIVLYFCGYSLKVILLDEVLKEKDLYITPWIGLFVVIMGLGIFYYFGIPVNDSTGIFLAIVSIFNLGVFIWKREGVICDKQELFVFLLLACIFCAIYSVIFTVNGERLYTFIIGNNDFVSYMDTIEYILTESLNIPKSIGVPFYSIVAHTFLMQRRDGIFFLAFFAKLFAQNYLEISYFIMVFISFLSILSFRLFLESTKKRFVLLLVSILFFNTFINYLLLQGFIGHLFSLGESIVILYLFYYLFDKKKRFCIRTSILSVCILTLSMSSYMEGIAYPIIPVVLFCVFILFNKRSDMVSAYKNVLLIAFLFLIFNFNNVVGFFKTFLHLNTVVAGWDHPFSAFFDIVGFYLLPSHMRIKWIIILFNVLSMVVLLKQIKKESWNTFLPITAYTNLLLYTLFFVMYDKEPGGSYKLFKLALSLTPIFLVLFLRYFSEKFYQQKRRTIIIYLSIFSIVYLFNVIGFVNTLVNISYNASAITKAHTSLNLFKENNVYKDSNFIVNCAVPWDQMAAEAALPIGRIYQSAFARGYYPPTTNIHFTSGDVYIENSIYPEIYKPSSELVFQNDIYSAYCLNSQSILFSEAKGLGNLQKIWKQAGSEFIDTARRVSDDNFSISFVSNLDLINSLYITLFDGVAMHQDISLDIFLNDVFVEKVSLFEGEQFRVLELIDLEIYKGTNTLKVEVQKKDSTDLYLSNLHFEEYYDDSELFPLPITKKFVIPLFVPKVNVMKIEDMRSEIVAERIDDTYEIAIRVSNTSSKKYITLGDGRVDIGIRLLDENKNVIVWDFGRIYFDSNIKKGETRMVKYTIPTTLSGEIPWKNGIYYLYFSLINEGTAWFPPEIESNISLVKLEITN